MAIQPLSSKAQVAGFTFPVKSPLPEDKLQDWELGGRYLSDPALGLQVKLWKLEARKDLGSGIVSVVVTAPGGVAPGELERELFADIGITEVALTFDQNMFPFVAYTKSRQGWIYWYDPTVPGMTHTQIAGARDLRCTLDDKRGWAVGDSDIVLAYMSGANLCARYQRERYQVEHVLKAGAGMSCQLVSMAMNVSQRLQFHLRGYALADDPGALIQTQPYLAEVVESLLKRSNVPRERIDTTQLWVPVEGYRIASEGGADVMIEPLQRGWFFDPYEADGKLRFQVRQRSAAVDALDLTDLVEQDGPALSIERAQEAELLRKVNLTTIDSSIDYVPNTQTAERRSGTVLAIGEQSSELPITCGPDFAATVARRQLTVAWGEMQSYKFSLPIQYSYLTPSDVVTIRDVRGRLHRMRVMKVEEDGGELIIEATEHAPWAYDAEAQGVQAAPPVSTAPGIVGDTEVIILNLPVLRDQDDELGVYVGALGEGTGWYGAEVQLSTDGGLSVGQHLQVTYPANAGLTQSALLGEVSAEYLSVQHLAVSLRWGAETITPEQLLRYGNLAALQHPDGAWEVLQFTTATETAPGEFVLGGLVRGRYATPVGAVPAGACFVLLDDNLVFVQLQQWMIGQHVSYRGVSYGQDSDEAVWSSHVVASPASQTEWPVHSVTATRDPSNAVTVSWVGRGRLGVETAPRHSRHFAGYRVIYSDGYTADTASTTHVRAGVPAGATVQVVALNSIAGPGPASEAIPT